jgi:hypothetical protein
VTIRPASSAGTLVNAAALLVAVTIVGLFVARGVWVLAYPEWGIIGALCLVVVLISTIAALDVLGGRSTRATEDLPVAGPLFARAVWAPHYATRDPDRAAAYRVYGNGGDAVLRYLDLPPRLVIERDACADLRAADAAYVAGKEPRIAIALDRSLGACAAHDGDTNAAVADYFAGSARASGTPARLTAASDAETDGFERVALGELRLGMSDPVERTQICTEMIHARSVQRATKFSLLLARYVPPAGTRCGPAARS